MKKKLVENDSLVFAYAVKPDSLPPARDATIGIAKALAMILIVLGHVWRAFEPAGLVEDPLLTRVDSVIYMSHLSVFAFLAGLFVASGMRRDGAWLYARARSVTFLWLFTLWSTLQLLMKIGVGSAVNDPVHPVELLRIWEPRKQFWFFGWITLMMLLAAAAKPWRSPRAAVVHTDRAQHARCGFPRGAPGSAGSGRGDRSTRDLHRGAAAGTGLVVRGAGLAASAHRGGLEPSLGCRALRRT